MVSWRASVNNGSLTIAHVLTSLSVGGGERVALLLAQHQAALGHRVLVASLEADGEDGLRRAPQRSEDLRRQWSAKDLENSLKPTQKILNTLERTQHL